MKKVILYVRVSTDEQAKTGNSLKDQEIKLIAYCKANNIEIVAIYREDYSAKTFNRPEFKNLIEFIKKNKNCADALLTIKWDRFSRNIEESYAMITKLRSFGIVPQAMEQPLDLSIPENKLMLAFYLAAPEVENDRRSMNILSGIRRARLDGRWTQQAPLGYKNTRDENNRPIIVPNEITKHITYLFNELAKDERSQQEIRLELARKGFKCSKNNFSKLLRNKVYIGLIRIKAEKDKPEYFVRGLH